MPQALSISRTLLELEVGKACISVLCMLCCVSKLLDGHLRSAAAALLCPSSAGLTTGMLCPSSAGLTTGMLCPSSAGLTTGRPCRLRRRTW